MSATTLQIPSIKLKDDTLTTTSTAVADFFGRRHSDVLNKIENMACSDEFTSANFIAHVQDIKIGQGAVRKGKVYEITQDGFTLLAMGFTGDKAMVFKEAYIKTFRAMETELLQKYKQAALQSEPQTKTIAPAQQLALRKAMEKYVLGLNDFYSRSILFSRSWHNFHVAFSISKLDQMPANRFDEGLRFIAGTWSPKQVEIKTAKAEIPDGMILINKDVLEGMLEAASLAGERYQEIALLEDALNIADNAVIEATRALSHFRSRTVDAVNMASILSTSCKKRLI